MKCFPSTSSTSRRPIAVAATARVYGTKRAALDAPARIVRYVRSVRRRRRNRQRIRRRNGGRVRRRDRGVRRRDRGVRRRDRRRVRRLNYLIRRQGVIREYAHRRQQETGDQRRN